MPDFISEDVLAAWVHLRGGFVHTRKVSNVRCQRRPGKDTIVCLTGKGCIVADFFTGIHRLPYPIVLVTIETDFTSCLPAQLDNPKLKHWFAWNVPANHHPKLTPIPIGLNRDRQQLPLASWMQDRPGRPPPSKMMLLNCALTTSDTRKVLPHLASTQWRGYCDWVRHVPFGETRACRTHTDGIMHVTMTSPKMYDLMSQYKFMLSPPGAGYDCHRTWEALYLGVIPILLSTPIDGLFDDLPVLIVKDWREVTEELLEGTYATVQRKLAAGEYKMEKLGLTYWKNLITERAEAD